MNSQKQTKTFNCCNHIYQIHENEESFGNLFLGSIGSLKQQVLSNLEIKSILTIMDKYMYNKRQVASIVKDYNIKSHKWVDMQDEEQSNIGDHFQQCFYFIDSNLKTSNVLVHCQAGISRSATIVIFYIMKKLNISLDQANKMVVSKRYRVSPNEGFWKCLQNSEQNLKKHVKEQQKKDIKQHKQDINIDHRPKGSIIDYFSKFSTQDYPQKFANHILCLKQDGQLEKGNLFLGQFSILKSHFLKSLKIKAIISVVQKSYLTRMKVKQIIEHEQIKNYLWLDIEDKPTSPLNQYFNETYDFIDKNLREGNVLVHCQAGVSRSASIVIAYVIKKFRVNYEQALIFVQSKRSVVKPNQGFQSYLIQQAKNNLKSE